MQTNKTRMRSWLVIAVLLATLIPTAANAWWKRRLVLSQADHHRHLAQGRGIAQPVGRAALLIRLHSGNFSFGDAQEAGNDIRFVAADDKTPLPFHIESFDPLLGVATVWVDISEMPVGATKDVWLYYGNTKATPASDAKSTFDVDYTLVYHFDGAAATPPQDKTAYANNAQTSAGADQSAIIGKGARLTGANPIQVPATPSLALAAAGAFSFEGWVKPEAVQPQAGIFVRRDGASALVIGLQQNVPFVEVRGTGAPVRITAPQAIAAGQWSAIAVTAGEGTLTLYVNGQPAGTAQGALPALNGPIALGGDITGQTEFTTLAGSMDEVRLSRITRPAALIQANVMSQGAESRLVVYGVDEKPSGFGFGYFGIIVQSVTMDAWVVIGILGIMALITWLFMWNKCVLHRPRRPGERRFLHLFREARRRPPSRSTPKQGTGRARRMNNASLFRVCRAAADEIERRAEKGGRLVLTAEAIEVDPCR